MSESDEQAWKVKQMRVSFEAEISHRLRRASSVKLQQFIPAHWFAAAASECAGMYISGFFYGTISVAQAYVEALSLYLAQHHHVRVRNDPGERCRRLYREKIISSSSLSAALMVLDNRNDFHHLNRSIEQDYQKLETRAEQCINHIHILESEIFAYSFSDKEPGKVSLAKPEYWPSDGSGLAQIYLRQLS